ncbi:MAG: glycosyltransferase family 4 protein [Candidatus Limnocylindrales bacterium]
MDEPRFGIDGRWLTGGPPSGVNYVRRVVRELAGGPIASQFVVFGRRGASDVVAGDAGMRVRVLPELPSLLFNTVAVPLRTPRSVEAVLYQNFTPPVSRAASVTVVHDLIFMSSPAVFTRAERAYLGLIPRLLPRARVVAADSENVRGQVLELFPRRDPASVVVAPDGVDERLLDAALRGPSDNERRELERLGLSTPYVLYLGRLTARKNLARLIRAFSNARLPEHRLVLAGAPSGVSENLAAVARDAGVGDRVLLLGRVDDAALPALYRHASAFAYVSFDEGFGVPPLEAMAFGIPVVCSDIATLRETAGGGGALFVSPFDEAAIAAALTQAVDDRSLRTRAQLVGPSHAGTYRWSNTARILREALELACQ